VKHADHQRHLLAKSMYRADPDDDANYAVVLDASRFSVDRMVEILLAAGAHRPAAEIMAEHALRATGG
jgi:cytidylate kinase